MKERPTPETDAKAVRLDWASTNYGDGSLWVALEDAQSIQRQRDEAREELRLIDNEVAFDEAWSDGKTLHEAVRIIIAQRDELLAALEGLVEAPDYRSMDDFTEEELAAWDKARAAIAAVKGGE